jgi:hypothetical protein
MGLTHRPISRVLFGLGPSERAIAQTWSTFTGVSRHAAGGRQGTPRPGFAAPSPALLVPVLAPMQPPVAVAIPRSEDQLASQRQSPTTGEMGEQSVASGPADPHAGGG